MSATIIDQCKVTELGPVESSNEGESTAFLRTFELSLPSVRVELCSLGAAITKFEVDGHNGQKDDIVLGYKDGAAMQKSGNPVFFGVIVGRVANRIAKGEFSMNGKLYKLETNNGQNHLHGGSGGFSHQVWNSKIVSVERQGTGENVTSGVQFSLTSSNGDQGYPASVEVVATYFLTSTSPSGNGISSGVILRLEMNARLLENDKVTPINLAQHSYFNLSRHDDPNGILDHQLTVEADSYTPVDETSIPTKDVQSLNNDLTMDWRFERTIREAILSYGINKKGLSKEQAEQNNQLRQPLDEPYGFDHNYIVRNNPNESSSGLSKVGRLVHGCRSLTVYSNAPGVQLYTANYLGRDSIEYTKAAYRPWQGICMETQHFPDSIMELAGDGGVDDPFAAGRCFLLHPGGPDYKHCVEYHFAQQKKQNHEVESTSMNPGGSDTLGHQYNSIEEMWRAQDLSTWYSRASDYYEENCSTTVDGVLGGLGFLSGLDLKGSRLFVDTLSLPERRDAQAPTVACECGAGIGRVTKGLLLDLCDRCDLIEPSERLLFAAPEYIGDAGADKCRYFCTGLQEWVPTVGRYTIVWIQWVLCYLTDQDIVSCLKRCGQSLVKGGIVILKENTCKDENFVVDVNDASVTRSLPYWKDLIERAGLQVVRQDWQEDLPDDIFPVSMLALLPK